MEAFNSLSLLDQRVVITYMVSGGVLVLFSYFIYSLKRIRKSIRFSVSALLLSVAFMLLSASGKIMNGYPENYTIVTFWVVIAATIIAFWVTVEMYRWNQRKIKEENGHIKNTSADGHRRTENQ